MAKWFSCECPGDNSRAHWPIGLLEGAGLTAKCSFMLLGLPLCHGEGRLSPGFYPYQPFSLTKLPFQKISILGERFKKRPCQTFIFNLVRNRLYDLEMRTQNNSLLIYGVKENRDIAFEKEFLNFLDNNCPYLRLAPSRHS